MIFMCFFCVHVFLHVQVCWLCEASKGANGDLHHCFTEVFEFAEEWWRTMLQTRPWTVEPSYAKLFGFHMSMVVPDLLHAYNLGEGRDVVLQSDDRVFGGASMADRLVVLPSNTLFHLDPRWRNRNSVSNASSIHVLHHRGRGMINLWLQPGWSKNWNFTQIYLVSYPSLLWSSNCALSIQCAAGKFLLQQERETIRTVGGVFLNTYVKPARDSLRPCEFLFRIRPKLHLISHVFNSTQVINQSRYSTWMDEDFRTDISTI